MSHASSRPSPSPNPTASGCTETGVAVEELRPRAEHGITAVFTWQLMTSAALSPSNRPGGGPPPDSTPCSPQQPYPSAPPAIRSANSSTTTTTAPPTAPTSMPPGYLVNTIDCPLGPSGPGDAHGLAVAHALSLPQTERPQLRAGQHFIASRFNHFHGSN